jgi:hypothetical protein
MLVWNPNAGQGTLQSVGDCGITVLFMCTAGHCSFLSVKVTCTDLVTLITLITELELIGTGKTRKQKYHKEKQRTSIINWQ